MQQGWNDTLEASITPVRLQCAHTDEQRLLAGPKPRNPGIKRYHEQQVLVMNDDYICLDGKRFSVSEVNLTGKLGWLVG